MKTSLSIALVVASLVSLRVSAQTTESASAQGRNSKSTTITPAANNLYLDVHHFGPGKVKYEDVAKAHAKDLSVQNKYGVAFINFWVDEKNGTVYCLSSSADSQSIRKTHAEAHGLQADQIYLVTDGPQATVNGSNSFFLDVHNLGAGNVTAKDAVGVHQKDLATQGKYGVNFINYWVDEKDGLVFCLSQAPDSSAVINTHKEAHGLLPASIMKVKQGE